MIAGNLYTKLQNAGKKVKRQGGLVPLLLAGILLFSVPSVGQTTTFNYSGGIVAYTVPAGETSVQITARGAQGGGSGGTGAIMVGNFTVTPGHVLNILVGGQGTNTGFASGGGGGSFVWDVTAGNTLLIAAGGGGGTTGFGDAGGNASATTSTTAGAGSGSGAGGSGGNGGSGGGGVDGGATFPATGGGGCGWSSNGGNGTVGTYLGGGGVRPLGGGTAGANGGGGFGGDGGFGGGGGAAGNAGAGGGGGGYNGGGGGNIWSGSQWGAGGGGGSFNGGTSQSNSVGNTGNGQVVITNLYTAPTYDNGSPQSTSICENSSATSINSLLTTSGGSGTLTWTVVSGPSNGSLSGFPATASAGTSVSPSGTTYQPTGGFSGTDAYTIQVSDGTSSANTVINVTVNPVPDVSNFSTSATSPCQGTGSSVTINSTSLPAGTYNVTYNLVGANSATGVVGSVTMASNTGTFTTSSLANAGGTTVIITGMTSASGCSSSVSSGNVAGFTVNANPGAIFVPGSVCVGATMTVASGTIGGTYTSSNVALATVGAASGIVTGIGAGNPVITYTLGTGCYTTAVITVNPTPNGISGSNTVCTGATTALTETTSGGTWSSSNSGVASVGSTGVVTGVTAGTPTISYTLPAGCFVTFPMTVNTTPAANTGTPLVCTGLTTTLANGTGGGTWTSSNTGQATVVAGTGVVTGVSAGNPTITYTVPNGCFVTSAMTVNTSPATIAGSSGVCVGANTTLTDATGGGTWTSSNTLLATVGSSTGLVNGVAVGTPTITYTVSNGCFSTFPMTVNPNPAAITGTAVVCTGSTTTLADATGGGTWSSSNTGLATVGSSTGVVTGVASGTPSISYTLATGCFATQAVTVNSSPVANSGASAVCVGSTTTLTNASSGGSWASSNPSNATVGSSTGIVTGIAAGNVTITYTLPNGCFATTAMTVNSNPSAIAGTFNVCTGATTNLTDGTPSGTWSSSNTGLATVGSSTGVVTGVAAGTPTISYTVSGCSATQVVTVDPTPVAISGPSSVCIGSTITLTDATSGGTWTSSSTGLATIGSSTGIVTGVSSGVATMTYTMPTGCVATQAVTVNPTPAAIAGSSTVCTGASTVLTDVTSGGTWSSGDVSKAIIGSSTGTVTGVAAGNVTMTYTMATGCFNTFAMTVNATPSAITGTASVCEGLTTTLSDGTVGGTWSSSNTSLATVVAGTGVVTGVASGIPTISYTLPTGCFATVPVTVNALPAAIGGSPIVCVGASTTLTDATSGGTWSSSNTALATIVSSTGVMTGVASGNPTITYTTAAGCIATVTATINPNPSAISGTANVCVGFTTTLSDATPSGTWSSSNTSLATVVAGTGVVTGVASGVPLITYTVPTGCYATYPVTVNPNPAAITGTTNTCVGSTSTLLDATGGGTWTSSNTGIATVGASSGVVSGVASGTVTITYTLGTGCFATTAFTVNPNPAGITGTATVCVGLTTTLSDGTSGGTWSSSNTSQATVVAGTGVVTGVAAGVPLITYTIPTGCYATYPVTVNANPSAITGTPIVCTGATTTLGSSPSGGVWSSSNIGEATVNAGTGVVTGVAAGNPVITYTLPTSCIATVVATVNPTPVAIAGTTSVCFGLTTTLTDATPGGTWSSSNTSQATVVAGTGVVTGIAAGVPIISYTLPTGCYATTPVTVNPNPAVITGATTVCTGSTIGLSDATTGGTWTSSDATKATVGSTSGVVTGVAAGTPSITYALPTGCIAIYPITVNTTPAAISGTTNVCTGFTTTLADATTGGVWSSSNTSEATVGSATGVVTGVATGNPTITYMMGTGCYATANVTVNQTPVAITGTTSVCVGATTALSDATTGGNWSSSNTAEATVGSSTGIVTGVAIGTPNISYVISSTGCYAFTNVTVNPTPASITGPTVVCAGSTITLSDATSGGVWSSGNTSTATVGSASGVVTGVAAGVVSITYSLGAGCIATATITVNPVPNISNYTATSATSPCVGSNSTVTISSTSLGSGTFTVTYDLSGANSVTGATATLTMGATTGTFTIPSSSLTSTGFTTVTVTMITNSFGCSSSPSSSNTNTFSVNPLPTAYTVLGGGAYCSGGSGVHIFLSNSVGGVNYQLWLGATAVGAPVAGTFSGLDFGLFTTVGTYTVTATNATTGCMSNMAGSATVSINSLPTAFTVTGGGSYCAGGTGVTVGLSGSQAAINYQLYIGGSPSGSPVAGTGSAISFGLQTAAGTYTVVATNPSTTCTNNMTGSATVVINPLPAAISGTLSVCPGITTTLTDATTGGTWSSSTPGVATIGSTTGVATGVTSGTSIITYTLGTGCISTATLTVNPNPAAISGPTGVCVGLTITLTDATGGGTWTSSNTALATINVSSGIVTGVAAGTPTMTYTLYTGCYMTFPITVNPTPAAISGTMNACVGATSTLTDATTGGTWSSSNAGIASVGTSSGVVTGGSAGTATITYTLPAGCTATTPFTVNPVPAAITGTTNVCVGLTTTLADAVSGGTWTSSNTAIATVTSTTGVVTGGSAGTATITYTLPAGCYVTTNVTVNPTPAAITGVNNVCVGLTTTLSDGTSGGTWSSSNVAIGTVGAATGIVGGISSGSITITYTLAAGGCNTTFAFTVNPNPAAIAGVTSVCVGSTTTLTDATTGGSWSSSNTTLASISGSGVVTGNSAGTPTITYALPTGCIATTPVTVNPLPASITGITTVCEGATVTLSDASGGGSWTSSNTAVASVGTGSGVVTGVAAGTATITYTLPTGCITTTGVTVNPTPAAIAGASFVCVGLTTTLSDGTSGGTWTSSNTSLATVGASTGVVTGVAIGTPVITYTLPAGCYATKLISVNPVPAAITGVFTVCEGATTTLSDATTGGTWTSANTAIATVGSSSGVVTGVLAGSVTMTYTLPGGCTATATITVNPAPAAISGSNNVCIGSTTTLADAVTGGTWTSSNSAVASVGSSTGVVTGASVGTATITYTLPAGCFTTLAFTVNPLPAAIGGASAVCVGAITTLTDASTGGTWTSSNTALATIGSSSGIVSGISAGSLTITYTLPTGCIMTKAFVVNPLPTVYTVTGGGSYCAGGSGVALGLSGSQSGVSYQLYSGVTAVGSPVAGTGAAISFGMITTAGTYTAVATNTTTSCQNNMTGSGTVTINNLPTVYNMTGGGNYCSGGTGVAVGLNGSQSGVNYQLYNGTAPVGSLVAGTGSAISFGLITGAGTYTVVATNAVTACVNNMAGTAVVIINPLPTAYTVTGGGSYCAGGTGVHIGLTNSTVGVNYILSNTSGVVATLAGTGLPIDFGLFTVASTYTVSGVNATTGCTNAMLGSVTVTINPLPTAYTVTGGGAYCFGGSGLTVGLSLSQTGVTYQLMVGGSPIGAVVAGTGAAISFGLQTATGTYTVVATNSLTGCTNTMTGSVTISTNPLPAAQVLTGGGSYCAGGTGVVIGLANTVTGTTYQLFRGSTSVSSSIGGTTGSAINFPAQTTAGTYTVIATITATGCTATMPGSVAISVNPLPNLYSVTGGGSYCAGTTGVHVGLTSSDVGINYQLYIGGSTVGTPVAGTGSALDFGIFTLAGTYTVVATNPLTGCNATMSSLATITINPLPTAFNVTGGGSYCSGGTGVSVGLSGSVIGRTYQLYVGVTAVGVPMLGTGSALNFGLMTTAGIYTVVATNTTTGCVNTMTGSAVVSINPLPITFTVSGGGSYCAGGTGVHILLSGSVVGRSYQLYNGTAPTGTAMAGTGAALDFGLLTAAGTYTVLATNTTTGCSATMTGSAVITINALPVVYAVTGGGAYCTGGTGVNIGVASSDTGVSYQLYNGTTPLGTPIAGTGSAISFGPQTTIGTYTVVATNNTTGCSSTMSGSVLVTINPLPATFTVTGGGSYCPGGSGVLVGLGGSATGVNYQLYLGTAPVGAAVPGTGIAISFGMQTGVGTYTVVAMDAATTCTNIMTGTAVVSLSPLPAAFTVTGGGGYCVGTTGAHVMLSGSSAGTNYQLYLGTTAVGTPVLGSGSSLDFGPQTGLGVYTVMAISLTTGCSNNMTGSVTVSLNPLPVAYNVTGGGGYCAGGTGVLVGLSSSNTSISYQLYRGTTVVGSPLAGTGGAISFGLFTTPGTYTVVATNSITGCVNNMNGSATVMINPLPIAYLVTGGGSYCAGGAGVSVGLMVSDIGINYQLYNGTTAVGVPVAGTGAALDFGSLTTAGTYTVMATDALTGCSSAMTGSVTITINPLPVALAVTGGGSFCAGGSGMHVGLAGSATGINYQLYLGTTAVGFVTAGTGAALDFGLQTAAGTYTVVATNAATGCTMNMTGSATIVVNPLPNMDTVTGGGNFCPGGSGVHVGLSGSTAGINYQLFRGTTAVGAPMGGTGSGLDFGAQVIPGTYFVVATNTVTGCTATMLGSAAVNISALPTAYNVAASSSSYCAGGAGVHITLSGSSIGTQYQLYLGTLVVGSPMAGTGFALDFGLQTSPGTYSVVATSTVTGCVNNMTGTPAVSVNSLPVAYTVTGGGSLCAGGAGVNIYLGGSEVGVNYQLMNGSVASGSPMAGTGYSLDFGPHTTAGTYTVVATNATTGCTGNMLSSATVAVNPLPAAFFVIGGGSYCAGGTGVHIAISGSDTGVNYQLFNGSVVAGSPVAGTGATLDFGLQTTAGTYTVVATNPITGCTMTMTGSATVAVDPLPAVFSVTGGGNYCVGGTGVHVGLSGSASSGVTYQLWLGVTPVGTPVAGTGSSIDFGVQTAAGTYTVTAMNTATGCSETMAGSTMVTISTLPNIYAVTGGGSYCASTPGVNVGISNSDIGVNYQLYNGTATVGVPLAGTGSALDFGLQPAGIYTVIAVNATTTCSSNMSGSATVVLTPSVVPSVTVTTGVGDTVCAGTTVNFTALAVNGGSAPTFQWSVNGISTGTTGSSYSYIPVNGDVVTVTMTSNATCALPATVSGSVTMTVRANITPSVTISVSPNDTVCQGTVVSFTPVPVFGGTSPGYSWFVNGVPAGSSPILSYAPANGDVVFCTLNSSYACLLTNNVLSNNIAMHVDDNVPPTVTISEHSGANVGAVVYTDTFTAVVVNGGPNPSFQWSLNGAAITGATNASYVAATLNNGDAISCVVTKSNTCGLLSGNAMVIVFSSNVGVAPVVVAVSDIRLVPNPNKGLFTVKGSLGVATDQDVVLEVTNMLGQVIYTNKVVARNGVIDQTIQLNNVANGMYILNFHSGSEDKVFHMVVEQ